MSMILVLSPLPLFYRRRKLNHFIQTHTAHEWLSHDQNASLMFGFLTIIQYCFKAAHMKVFCKV